MSNLETPQRDHNHPQSKDTDESIRDNTAPVQSVKFSERASLTLSVVALALAGIAIGVLIMMPALIDAKVQAGIAKAEATSHAADTNARVAIDKVEEVRVQLAAKGILTTIN